MIFISAGHHPSAPGACYGSFCEHDEAVRWASEIVKLLDNKAMLVPAGVLREKVAFINSRSPTLALEIHFNAAKDKEGRFIGKGSETLYYPGSVRGRLIAEVVQANISRVFAPDRGVKEGWYRMNKNKGPDFFLAKTKCPAVIVEPEFIHRESIIKANRELGCNAIATAILEASNNANWQ